MSRQTIWSNGQYDYVLEIILEYNQRLETMASRYSRVCIIHLVLSWPQHLESSHANQVVGEILNAIRRKYQYHKVTLHYGWVREVGWTATSGQPHYHIGILVNGHEVQNGYGIGRELNTYLQRAKNLDPQSIYVEVIPPKWDCQSAYNLGFSGALMLRCNAPDAEAQMNNAKAWLSYHAKCDTKGSLPRVREYGFSRL